MSYFYIDPFTEYYDIQNLSKQIAESGFVDEDVVIVNCSPDYSSIVCQYLQHNLSSFRKNIPLTMENLEMPYPNQETFTTKLMVHHAKNLVGKWIKVIPEVKFLFVDSGCLRGTNFKVLQETVDQTVAKENRKFACLYLQDDSIFQPDFYVKTFNFEKDGGLLFHWENKNNPFWPW